MRKVGKEGHGGRPRVQSINNDPSETIQSDAHLADMNTILRTFGQEGVSLLDETALQFRDVSGFTDLADALAQAKEAEVEFMKLPSKVREVFDHDVAVWLDTAHDQDKRDILLAEGFIKPVEESTKRKKDPPAGAEASARAGKRGSDVGEVVGTDKGSE